jgi:peptide/nickel transport system substrate-binding protein
MVLSACAGEATPTATAPATATTTAPTQANWWDKFGTPEYGGSLTLVTNAYAANFFDVTNFGGGEWQFWHESLFEPDWTVDRQIWSFNGMFTPDQYWSGALAESWDQTDAQTIIVHLRQGVHWQNKPPVNGREFTSDDVVQHYDRMRGTGSGYTEGVPMFMGMLSSWERVTATDKYTVVFRFKTPSAGVAFQSISDMACFNIIECPESVKEQGGALTDWTKAVGTGPFILTDFIANSAMTMSRNPDYWGTDPRHPENKMPYADKATLLIIPDSSTQLAALRTGKIDIMTGVTWQQSKSLKSTNPDILQFKMPAGGAGSAGVNTASGVSFRFDKAPFTDINVRKALNLAIDRKAIAEGYYGGTASLIPCGIITQTYKGFAYDYNDWPQSLKDEYSYNPTKAKELLAAAGYPNGFKTNVVAATTDDLQLLQAFKDYFKDIGVDMEIRAMDTVAAHAYTEAGKHDQMIAGGGGFTWPPTRVIDQYYSKSPNAGSYGINDAGYDAIRDKFWSANSPDEAAKALMEADKYIIENHFIVVGPESFGYNVCQPYVKGYSGEALLWGQKWLYSRLWIDQALKH